MPFRPPLTIADLTAIRARYEIKPERAPCSYQDSVVWEDILALLYEVKRLRAERLVAYQLRDCFRKPGNFLDTVWEEFMINLESEPCVLEQTALTRELTAPAHKNQPAK
jgi:hypothetical protein